MRRLRLLLARFLLLPLALSLTSPSSGREVRLEWDANSEPDLAGYRLHWGLSPGVYINYQTLENVTAASIEVQDELDWFIAATALDTEGNESGYSNEVLSPAQAVGIAPATDVQIRWSATPMALTLGTNCGFVASAPVDDPAGSNLPWDSYGIVGMHRLPADAVMITEIGFYVDNDTEEANWRAAIYDDDGAVVPGEAGTRLFISSDAAKGTTAGWKKITGLTWDVSAYADTDLWIGVGLDDTATATQWNWTNSGGSGVDSHSANEALGTPFGGGAIIDADAKVAIYAVYTTAGGASLSIPIAQAYYRQRRN